MSLFKENYEVNSSSEWNKVMARILSVEVPEHLGMAVGGAGHCSGAGTFLGRRREKHLSLLNIRSVEH
jgi:hypothetical protein